MQSGQCIVTQKDVDSVLGKTFSIRIWQLFGSGSGNYSDPDLATIRIRQLFGSRSGNDSDPHLLYTYDIPVSAFNAHEVIQVFIS